MVIAVLGVLAAIVVFAVSGITDKGQAAACTSDAHTLRTAEETYFAQHGDYASEATLVSSGLLQTQSSLNSVTVGSGSYSVVSTGACATQMLNDDFEPPAVAAAPSAGWYTVSAGASVGPWTVTGGSIDVVSTGYWPVAGGGTQDVDLNGSGYGVIARNVTGLTVGKSYMLSFSYAINPGASSAGVRIQVANLDQTLTATNPASTGYQTATYAFTAAHTTEMLTFTGSGPNQYCGVVLDNIQVAG